MESASVWPDIKKEHKPWSYWWWMGNAVDKENLTALLEEYYQAGLGGMHIVPIYGVRGEENNFIQYLSSEWIEMLGHTVSEAKKLGMGIDMTTGTGWPFGGPNVTNEITAATMYYEKKILNVTSGLISARARHYDQFLQQLAPILAVMAYSDDGDTLNLTEYVDSHGRLAYAAQNGTWELYLIYLVSKRNNFVERAAPGGEGKLINPFMKESISKYLERFDDALLPLLAAGQMPRAQYHDSYEYHRTNWTPDFFDQFQAKRGYDLRIYFKDLIGQGGDVERRDRVRCDFRESLSDLILENLTTTWADWSHQKGSLTRNQAHGSPGNILDLYGVVDIPETEIFGPSRFNIPGLRYTEPTNLNDRNRINSPFDINRVEAIKFAASAAHVTGKNLVSSESCTWLGEHFAVSLAQVKPEIDQLFISGVNHVFYHGIAYSPLAATYPGWLFYASTNFAPSNSFWQDFPKLNNYIARCQSILQAGKPDSDILVYFPVHDIWTNKTSANARDRENYLLTFSMHFFQDWLTGTSNEQVMQNLIEDGYSFDLISDRQLLNVSNHSTGISTGGNEYDVIVVPKCHRIPLGTFKKLYNLAENGAKVFFLENLPQEIPGMFALDSLRSELNAMKDQLSWDDIGSGSQIASIGMGSFIISNTLTNMKTAMNVPREPIVDQNIQFIRRSHENGKYYFFTNLWKTNLDGWVELGIQADNAIIMDPMTGETGIAALRRTSANTEVYLQIKPGESLILKTLSTQQADTSKWFYTRPQNMARSISGPWDIHFIKGGPVLPSDISTSLLDSWTDLAGYDSDRFAGTASYKTTFVMPQDNADDWLLRLGSLYESARILVNDREVGTVIGVPYEIKIGDFLKPDSNTIEIQVSNLMANSIRDLDRRGVYWRKFYEINFVNKNYQQFNASNWKIMPSGLEGPVELVPLINISDELNTSIKNQPNINIHIDGKKTSMADYVNARPKIQIIFNDTHTPYVYNSNSVEITLNENKVSENDLLFSYDKLYTVKIDYSPELRPGNYSLTVSIKGSSISKNIEFAVDQLTLTNVINYPNPFSGQTSFFYELSRDVDKVVLSIYTISGRKIFRQDYLPGFLGTNEFEWDGQDADGDHIANGTYLYKIEVKSGLEEVYKIDKIVKLR